MEEIERLYQRFLRKECTREEAELLLDYFSKQEHGDTIQELIAVELAKPNSFPDDAESIEAIERNRASLKDAILGTRRRTPLRRIRYPYWLAAAGLVLASLLGVWLYQRSNLTIHPKLTSVYGDDVLPGGNRATLTFDDGTAIPLNNIHTGIVVEETQLRYVDGSAIAEQIPTVDFATLSTPRGGQYQITLPDGTKVWLNAASSLEYPTNFGNDERIVTLEGEAFFEVSHNPTQPFVVQSREQRVKVLGTSFNVNAYTDEALVATTLVDGSIRIYHGANDEGRILQPGDQAVSIAGVTHIKQVDVQDYTAWKEGVIILNNADLPTIIRQIERWYDVEFVTPVLPETEEVIGELRRDVNLSDILDALHEYYGLNFKIDGRRIIASK